MSLVLIQFGLSLLAGFLGLATGWWLRGRPKSGQPQEAGVDRQQIAEQTLQSLHAVAEAVRTCVEQHAECIRAIEAELKQATSTEPAIISSAAASIIASNGLVQHQFDSIRSTLDDKRQEIRKCLAASEGLLYTFAAIDRQHHAYRQVLSSLQVLAAELANQINGHKKRLQDISGDLAKQSEVTPEQVTSAVAQILDATDEVQRHVAATEKNITAQAETVHMQAILTHTDLLTSLPNRRALEAELERVSSPVDGRSPVISLILVDLDQFAQINIEYGHKGGDVVLRQVAGILKQLVRGRDMVARYGSDTFAILLNQTTLHDALPIAERARRQIQETQFSRGTRPLQVTASLGIAQLTSEEMRGAALSRVDQALVAAQRAGGNICFRHDGRECYPVSSIFHAREAAAADHAFSLASLWRDSAANQESFATPKAGHEQELPPALTGRSLFAANLGRRLAEWKRGGPNVSVALLRVDQLDEVTDRFGEQGEIFLRQVIGRLLEAVTRDMDERCEFEDGLFALLLPGMDETNAVAVAERLRNQVGQCKVRMGEDLWGITVSIGVAHCTTTARVMDIILAAEAARREASKAGGDAVCVGHQPPLDQSTVATPST